jgi:hypothetical protein
MPKVVPYGLKISYYAFMTLMFPAYITYYPFANFFNLCQLHLFLVLISFLTDTHLFISMSALGISIIQFFWCLDLICETIGINFIGGTKYMYDTSYPLYLRSLSLFHAWFPFFLLYLIKKVGYDKRALYPQFILSNSVCLLSYYNIDLYNENINMMKDVGIFGLFCCSIAIFTTHQFLLWWV